MRMTLWCAAVLVVAAGCAAPGPAAASASRSVVVDGVARTYLLHRPAGTAAARAVPLVVVLHGGGGSGAQAQRTYGWDAVADREGFAVAYPDGLRHSWGVGGGCCGPADHTGAADVAFIGHLVADAGTQLRIDPARVYATGISEGGMMSYRLACDSTLFAAIGPVAATTLGPCPAPRPLSVIHVHGTADTRIRYDGTPGAGRYRIDGPPVPELDATWRGTDRCGPPTVTATGPVTVSTAACAAGRAVELVTIAGAGHQWPGAPCGPRCAGGVADPPSTDLDATATIWRFFAAHPSPPEA